MRAQNEPPETAVRTPDGPIGCRLRPGGLARERLCLAAEPRLAARRRGGGRAPRRAHPRPLRRAGREGDAARGSGRRGRCGREAPGPRARAGGERAPPRRGADRRQRRRAGASGPGRFDRALVDAPCSGLGVLNSRPDLRWRAEPLPDLQLALLRVAAERVRPGGTITYAVCTIYRAENEDVVDALGLPVEDLGAEVAGVPPPAAAGAPAHAPARPRDAGFFVARLRA